MANSDLILEGVVTEQLKGLKFRVRVKFNDETEKEIVCTVSGKIQMNMIKILVGDKVSVTLSPYNMDLGKISYRHK